MRLGSFAVQALAALIAVVPPPRQRPVASAPAPQEYAVYRAVLSYLAASHRVQELLVVDGVPAHEPVKPTQFRWYHVSDPRQDSLNLPQRDDLVASSDSVLLGQANTAALRLLPDSLRIGLPITLLPTDILSDTEWSALNARHPGRGPIVRLSRAQLSADGRLAALEVSLMAYRGCGSVRFCVLRRTRSGEWVVVDNIRYMNC